jgi:1-acyl-sn-glycerol-3-phosphate acyltransferase
MIRTLLVLLWISLILLLTGPPLLLFSAASGSPRCMYATARFIVGVAFAIAGVRLRVRRCRRNNGKHTVTDDTTGLPLDIIGNYIFMANHLSNVDPPVCLMVIPQDLKVIFKKELLRLPILATAMKMARCIPVDRKNREAARLAIDQAAEQLKQGDSFLIFPEGTRSRDGTLGPFKSGGFVMSILSGVPVIPMTLRGTQRIQSKGSWKLNSGEIEVIVHDPMRPPSSLDEKDHFLEKVRAQIESAL